jgi:MFS family permease
MSTPAAPSRRNVWLLVLCMGAAQTVTVAQVAMAALIGHSLADDKALATLPVAVWMTGTMASSIPAALIFRRLGRRAGFVAGTLSAALGCALMALALWRADFWLYTMAALPFGLGFGISQHYRFAAAEVADKPFRAKAVSYVMVGGVVAAVLGPEIVRQTKEWFGPVLFMASYAMMAFLLALNLVVLAIVELPPPPPPAAGTGRPLSEIIRQQRFLAAAIGAAAGYGAMNLLMTSTPIEMMLCGFTVNDSARVIQWHAVAMFAPSFITGSLITRFGAGRVIIAGAALTAISAVIGISGATMVHFVVALVFLGLGWNFMFVGGTSIQAEGWSPAERPKAQALNDLIVFSTTTATAFGSGAAHYAFGWTAINLGILVPLAGAALAVPLLLRAHARAHPPGLQPAIPRA